LAGAVLSRPSPPCLLSLPLSCPREKEPCQGPQEALPAGGRLLGQATGHWVLESCCGSRGAHQRTGVRASRSPLRNPLYSCSFLLAIKEGDRPAAISSSWAGKGPPAGSPELQAGRSLAGERSSTWPRSSLGCLQGKQQRPKRCPRPAGPHSQRRRG